MSRIPVKGSLTVDDVNVTEFLTLPDNLDAAAPLYTISGHNDDHLWIMTSAGWVQVGGGAAPSWDATLAIGNTTSRNTEYIATPGGSNYIFEYVTPENYDGVNQQRFLRWVDSTDDNEPDTRHDIVGQFWGYNMGPGSGVVQAGEAAFGFKTETFYHQDSTTLCEFHLPEFVDNGGVYHRLFSMYTHRPTGFTYLQSQISTLSFRRYWDNSGSTDYFYVNSGDQEGTHVGLGAQMQLSSSGAAGQNVLFRLIDGDGSNYTFTGTGQFLYVNSPGYINIVAPNFLAVPSWVAFNTSDRFGDGNVYLECNSDASGKGFLFGNAGLSLYMFKIYTDTIQAWIPFISVSETRLDGRVTFGTGAFASGTGAMAAFAGSGAAYPQIHLSPAGVAVTSPTDGDIWLESNTNTGLKIRINGVTKTVSLV